MNCLICASTELTVLTCSKPVRDYFQCSSCNFIFLNPQFRISADQEKARYLEHNNDVHDSHYQNFVRPLVDQVQKYFQPGGESLGLDFGSGTGPVLTHLLTQEGFQVESYDPFFAPELVMNSERYDFIVTCEVVEHFFDPVTEFKKLRSYLKPHGKLIAKTQLWTGQALGRWYYTQDPTHVSFYSEPNLKRIQGVCHFSQLECLDDRVFIFTA